MNESCYDNVIGLTRFDCSACNPGVEYPTGYNTSLSGLFLDDLAEMAEVKGLINCENGTVFQILEAARAEGIKRFIADINNRIYKTYRAKNAAFQGAIGGNEYSSAYTGTATWGGIRIKPKRTRSGVFKLTAIGSVWGSAGAKTVKIYDNTNTQIGTNITINTLVGFNRTVLSTPIELPLYSAMNPDLEYFIVTDPDGGKVNKLWCGCNSWNPRWCLTDPWWNYPVPGSENQWAKWLMAGGYESDDLTSFNEAPDSADNTGYGLLLEGRLYCNAGEAICSGSLPFDGSNSMDFSIAFAIRYAAADCLIQQLCLTTKLSRATVVNREALQAIRPEFEARYKEHVDFIADNLPLDGTDCLTCNPVQGVSVGKTFA